MSFAHKLFESVFIKNDNIKDFNNISLDPSFIYKANNFDVTTDCMAFLTDVELKEALMMYSIKMNYTNYNFSNKKINLRHESKVDRVLGYITDKIDDIYIETELSYSNSPNIYFYYGMVYEVFKKEDNGCILDDTFSYNNNTFDYVKHNIMFYSMIELRDILYLYDIQMDYYDYGNDYTVQLSHQRRVNIAITAIENRLELEYDSLDISSVEDDSNTITPNFKSNKFVQIHPKPFVILPSIIDMSSEEEESEDYLVKDGVDIKDKTALIDNFLEKSKNHKEFKNLLGLHKLVIQSDSFVSSLDQVLNDYHHLESQKIEPKSNNKDLVNLSLDLKKSKQFIDEIKEVCSRYKFNNKYQNFLQDIWNRLEDQEEGQEEDQEDYFTITI